MKLTQKYLERLADTETPKYAGMYDGERQEQAQYYCELRNSAKDLLINPKDNQAREKLSQLIKKLGLN